jgi:DNA-binding transcriptional LysR family regulator
VVGFDASLDRTPGAQWLAQAGRGGRIVSRANTVPALVALLAAGQGVGVVPCFVGRGLERLTDQVLASNELYAVVHEDQRDVPRVRVVFDALVEGLMKERELLSGRITRA